MVPLFDDGGPTKEMLYVIGGAAVGKSTYIKQNLAMTHIIIDPDTLKDVCPLKDPDPDAKGSPTYLWTKKRVAELMESALAEPGRYVIVGTGGTTGSEGGSSKKAEYLRRARAAGFKTKCVYLICPADVAVQRNRSRPKGLSDDIVLTSLKAAEAAFKTLRDVCDEAEQIDVSMDRRAQNGRRQSLAALKAYAKLGALTVDASSAARRSVRRLSFTGGSDGLRRSASGARDSYRASADGAPAVQSSQ